MSQPTLWHDKDAQAAAEAERETISRPVADIIAAWRAAYLARWQQRKQAGTLPAHIMANIKRNEEMNRCHA